MPEPLTTRIDNWRNTYMHISSDLYNFRNYLEDAANQCDAQNWAGLANSFRLMKAEMYKVQKHFYGGSPNLRTTTYAAMDWIDDNWPTGNGEVTMAAILQAMYQANFTELQEFISYVDAYRGALWDEWFNISYHSELVRGFRR